MNKRDVSFFVSYAKANKESAGQFLGHFREQVGAAKRFSYSIWSDHDIAIGADWHKSIQHAIRKTDFGLLLVSPAFLNSEYIGNNELPHYLDMRRKNCFPVMLAKVDLARHDLKGLQERQIFRLDSKDFDQPRAFTETKRHRRIQFVEELFAKVDDWLYENHR